jgi:hypothetical protein
VGDLQGQDAGEGVDADVVVGRVVHGAEGDHVGVFELAEGEFGLGLAAVAGHHVGDRPVLAVGDQDTLAEDLGFQVGAGLVVDVESEPVLGR